jgi:predicted ATPase/DNA-binding SARP family transcriptional activator
MAEATSGTLRVLLFGQPQVLAPQEPAWRFAPKRKTLELLAYLTLHQGAPIGRDTIAFTLWPDEDEEDARANLRRNLHVIGPLLPAGPPWIVARPETLQLNPHAGVQCDVEEFRRAYERREFAAAAQLYRGELLEGYSDEWILEERERLIRAYHDALTQLVRTHRTRREFDAAAAYARMLLDNDPWREDVVRHLIAIRYEAGDRAAALRVYDSFAERLRAEMNVDPMPETLALRDAILRSRATGDDPARVETIAPSVPQPAWTLPFVGRERELETLRACWNRAATGAGAFVFLSGEAGIGKSSLMRAVAAHVGDEGGRVLSGGTSSPERFPYQPILDAFAGAPSLIAASGVAPMRLDALHPLLPEMFPLAGKGRERTHTMLDPAREQTRLFEAIARVLEALATDRPLVLIAEDVHWAGTATVDLLSYFSTRLVDAHVLVIVTYRAEDAAPSHPLHALRRELTARSRATALALGPLCRADVEELIARLPGSAALENEAATWHERSAGNPLFLGELVRDVLERGETSDAVPAHLAAAITARLDRLSDRSRVLVDLAAAMGDVVDFEVVTSAAGWDEAQIVDALAELLDRRILRETFDRARLRYAFTHNLVRRAAYDAIAPARRRAHHRVIAGVLERSFAERLDDYVTDIAGHYAACDMEEVAASWYLRGARAALAVFANADAAERASRALPHARDRVKTELLLVRATALQRLGERTREAEDLLLLRDLATESGNETMLCDALERLVRLEADAGRFEGAASYLADLRERTIEGDARSAAADELAAQIFEEDGLADEAAKCLERAALAYRAHGDPREIRALGDRAVILARRGELVAALAVLEHTEERMATVDDPVLRLQLAEARLKFWGTQQEFSRSQTHGNEVLRLAQQLGERTSEANALHSLAIAAGKLRNFELAEKQFAAAIAIHEQIGGRWLDASLYRNYAALQSDRCRWKKSLELLDLAEPLAGTAFHATVCAVNRMDCLSHLGDVRAAKDAGERAERLAVEAGLPALRGCALAGVGAALLALGEHSEARTKLEAGAHLLRTTRVASYHGGALADSIDLYLAASERPAALHAANEILELSEAGTVFAEPARALWATARALGANGEAARAGAARRQATAEADAMLAALGPGSPEAAAYAELPWHRSLRGDDDSLE